MRELPGRYAFYKLKLCDRRNLIGQRFKVKGDPYENYYYPIELSEDGRLRSYGEKVGVIGLYVHNCEGKIPGHSHPPGTKWFGVHAFSPDDLDLGMWYMDVPEAKFKAVCKYLWACPKLNTSYGEVLRGLYGELPPTKSDGVYL